MRSHNRVMIAGAFVLGAMLVATAIARGQSAARSYESPTHSLPADVQYDVDLAFLLLNGDVSTARLPQVLIGGGVIPTDGKTPLQELSGKVETIPPFKAFDQLYYFGMNTVGSWALNTSDGIILFDTLNNTEEAQRIIEGGMKTMGLDPTRIKYIVIMHGHADHFGGAKYLQDKYHPRVLMGAADWDMVARPPRPNGRGQTILPPTRDMDVTDSQKLTLGGQTVTLYLTPGHTPATISAIIPVTDEGRPHVLAFWGGTGFPGPLDPTPTAGGLKVYQQQLFRYAKIGIDAKVDGLIANHAVADGTPQKALVMRSRKKGDPNPYIFGQSTFIRVMGSFISAVHAAVVTREQATPRTSRP